MDRLRASWFGAFSSLIVARAIASAATFLTIAVLGRTLGPAHYGDLVVLLTILKIASEFIGPALDTALVRFVGAARDDEQSAITFANAVLRAKAALAIATVLLGLALALPIQRLLFARDGVEISSTAIVIAFVAAALTVLAMYAQSCFQAWQRFTGYARFEVAAASLRLFSIVALVLLATDSILALFIAYAAAPIVVALCATPWLPSTKNAVVTPAVWRDLAHFAKWVVVACACTSLAQRVDILLVAGNKLPPELVSQYGAAVQLTLLGDLVIITLFNVLLPKASRLTTREELLGFLRSFRLPTLFAFAGLLPLLLASGVIAHVTFGADYTQTGTLFSILLVGAAFALGSAPAGATLYGLGHSRTIAALECFKLLAILIGGAFAVPGYGVVGMAWTVAVVRGALGVATYAMAYHHARHLESTENTR